MITLYQGDYISLSVGLSSNAIGGSTAYTLIGSLSGSTNVSGILEQNPNVTTSASYTSTTTIFTVPSGCTAQITNFFFYTGYLSVTGGGTPYFYFTMSLGTTTPALGGSPTVAPIYANTFSSATYLTLDSRSVWSTYV